MALHERLGLKFKDQLSIRDEVMEHQYRICNPYEINESLNTFQLSSPWQDFLVTVLMIY